VARGALQPTDLEPMEAVVAAARGDLKD